MDAIALLTRGVIEFDGCRFAAFYFARLVQFGLGTRDDSYFVDSALGWKWHKKSNTHTHIGWFQWHTSLHVYRKWKNNLFEKCRGRFTPLRIVYSNRARADMTAPRGKGGRDIKATSNWSFIRWARYSALNPLKWPNWKKKSPAAGWSHGSKFTTSACATQIDATKQTAKMYNLFIFSSSIPSRIQR